MRFGKRCGGVGHGAQGTQVEGLQRAEVQDHRKRRRHAREHGDALARHRLENADRESERTVQHHARADPRRHEHLVEPVVEGNRQHVENDVVFSQLQIRADGSCRRHHVQVAQHDALRVPGRAGGVDDAGEILIDGRRKRERRALVVCDGFVEGNDVSPRDRGISAFDHDESGDAGRRIEPGRCNVFQRAVRDECASTRVVEQVGELVRLGLRVDRHEHGAGFERGEDADDGLGAVVQEDGDPVATPDGASLQRRREPRGACIDIPPGQALGIAHERDLRRSLTRVRLQPFVQ